VGAGHLEVREAGGKVLVSRRPLPSGILPHGPEAVRLLERWDRAYRDGRRPPWDLGAPAAELRKAVEEGTIRPGHALEVGCGSGTDAVYLASQGFKVTAVDIAPTALAIAEAKARTAGVRVEWLLADVLALPDIGPFDFVYDRGCYHNVRYVDAAGFIEGLRRVSRPGTRCLILSLNRSGPPGVTEERMRGDFARGFEVEWLRPADIGAGPPGPKKPNAWSLLLRRRSEPAP
jgi:SAM-dependent methyltransferase